MHPAVGYQAMPRKANASMSGGPNKFTNARARPRTSPRVKTTSASHVAIKATRNIHIRVPDTANQSNLVCMRRPAQKAGTRLQPTLPTACMKVPNGPAGVSSSHAAKEKRAQIIAAIITPICCKKNAKKSGSSISVENIGIQFYRFDRLPGPVPPRLSKIAGIARGATPRRGRVWRRRSCRRRGAGRVRRCGWRYR